jgi:predicted O-methyltransferase YrrM
VRHEDLERVLRRQDKQLRKRQQEQTQQVEALIQLHAKVRPRAPMPPSGLTALNPTALLELWHIVEQTKPGLVLELGSGTSTVWLGYALAQHGGRLVSIEHGQAYAEITRGHVRRHGLGEHVEVRDAPLVDLTLDDRKFMWYDDKAFTDLDGIELLFVDGPPGVTNPYARLPALPVLEQRLAPQAIIILDDARRADEQEIIANWQKSAPAVVREPVVYGRMAVLTYTRLPS